jgi:hypothetical protein
LINSRSRAKTGETGQVWPVKIAGFARHWSIMSPEFGMSSVAVVPHGDSACNGVLIEISAQEIPHFDQREQGYQRSQVCRSQLSTYCGAPLPEGTVWIYHSQAITTPNPHCPIALSYVDVILAGCLEHGDAFVDDFLRLTDGWHHPMLNDRLCPRYPRVQPELHAPTLNKVLRRVTHLTHEELSVSYES